MLRTAKPGESRLEVVARACQRGRSPDRVCNLHHRRRIPAAFHSAGGRGQDLPSACLHSLHGHVWIPGLCPAGVAGDGMAADAAAKGGHIQRERPRRRGLESNLRAPGTFLRQATRRSRCPGRRAARARPRDRAPAGLRVHAVPAGGHARAPPDHGAFDRAHREHTGCTAGRKAAHGAAGGGVGGDSHRPWRGRRPHRPGQQCRDVPVPETQERVEGRHPGRARTGHPGAPRRGPRSAHQLHTTDPDGSRRAA